MNYHKLIALTILIFFTSFLFADKMNIAVLDLEARGVDNAISLNVSDLIRTEMINSGRFTVLERAQLKAILKEQSFQQTGCTDISCAVKIGKLISANKILIGSIMKFGGKIVISGRIVDVEKGVADFSAK